MAAIRCTRQDQDDVRKIVSDGGSRILVAFRANLGVEPQLYEVESFDRASNTFTMRHPAIEARLRSQAFASNLYIGEHTREIGDPLLDLLRGMGRSTVPYMARRPDRTFRVAGAPRSPERGFGDLRRGRVALPLGVTRIPAAVSSPKPLPSGACSHSVIPLGGSPRPSSPTFRGGPLSPGIWTLAGLGAPGFGPPVYPSSRGPVPAPMPYLPLPRGPPPPVAAGTGPFPTLAVPAATLDNLQCALWSSGCNLKLGRCGLRGGAVGPTF